MPFIRSTLSALRNQALQAFDTRLGTVVNPLRRRSLRVSADVMAGMTHQELGYLDWMVDGVFLPDKAETTYLERHARLRNITRLAAATAGGNAVFTGVGTIPAATLVQSADGSVQYATQSALTLSAGTGTVAIVAVTGGVLGNALAGATLPLVVAVAGIGATATVAMGGLTGGLDQETDAGLRIRLLRRLRTTPQGGANADYIAWASAVAGVTRVWVYPLARGAGTADVTFVLDGRASILPLAADIAAVQASIAASRPVTADSVAFGLTASPINITIANLYPNTAATQLAIDAALAVWIATNATPGGATVGDGVSPANPGGHVWLDQIYAAIANAAGVQRFDLTSPTSDSVMATGIIPTLGTVSFV